MKTIKTIIKVIVLILTVVGTAFAIIALIFSPFVLWNADSLTKDEIYGFLLIILTSLCQLSTASILFYLLVKIEKLQRLCDTYDI